MADAVSATVGTVATLFGILFTILWLALFVAIVASFVVWIIMLVDAAKRDFKKSDEKAIWILIIVLGGVIGAIVYYFVVKRHAKD